MVGDWLLGLGVFGTGLAIFVGVNALFFKADDFFSKEFKDDVALRLLCLESPDAKSSWPDFFVQLFDKIFSKQPKPGEVLPEWRRHLSERCFWRSCAASIFAVIAVTVVRTSLLEHLPSFSEMFSYALIAGVFSLFINLFPDYLSLLETRYLLRFMEMNPSVVTLALLLFADTVFTVVIFVVVGLSVMAWIEPGAFLPTFLEMLSDWKQIMWIEEDRHPLRRSSLQGLFFYSTFFTSAWLWLFALSQLFFRAASQLDSALRLLKYALPIETRPFRSMGIVAGLIAMLGYWAFAAFKLVGQAPVV